MFQALLAHLQEVLYKRKLVYWVRVMYVGCYQGWSGTSSTPTMVTTNRHNMYPKYQQLFVQRLLKMGK
jgi:hypothetical protein